MLFCLCILCATKVSLGLLTQQSNSSIRDVQIASCAGGQAYGVQVGDYNLTLCNKTAWTFRSLWFQDEQLLSPTGFTQVVSNINLPPNTAATVWPPLRPVHPGCPVIPQGPNGRPAP